LIAVPQGAGIVTPPCRSPIQSVTNVTTSLASNLQYEPFGPLKGLTYGNGINETRSYDLAGRLSGITAPGKQSQTFGYDAADNLTSEIEGQFTYIGISTAPLNRYMQSVARPSKTWNE